MHSMRSGIATPMSSPPAGVGPTHSDITAACVAQAFGVPIARSCAAEHVDALITDSRHRNKVQLHPPGSVRTRVTDTRGNLTPAVFTIAVRESRRRVIGFISRPSRLHPRYWCTQQARTPNRPWP
jgi:hypothetical protein